MRQHYHRTDPATSRKAAEGAAASGTIQNDTDLLARLIAKYPGESIKGLARLAGVDQIRLARRAGDIRRKGLGHTDGELVDGLRWWPGPEPEDATHGSLFGRIG